MASKNPLLIRVSDAAERYSVSRATINRALRDGKIPRIKRGRCTLMPLEDADAWALGTTSPDADSRT
ncbi:MAG: helix-turn-helix domain-containing protein [Paracoccaceae bacterium]